VEYVNLGSTGLRVSRVCLGMMSFGAHESRRGRSPRARPEPIVRRAVEGGITFFDTADVYNGGQSEVVTGRVLPKLLDARGARRRDEGARRTMPGENGAGLSRKHVLASIDASLERLGLDYVDLYQIHRWDPTTPIEETMEALHDVVKAGKARYIGASSMFAWQFAKAQATPSARRTRFVSMQNHYNLVYREEEREMIPQCIDQGVACCPGARSRAGCWPATARGRASASRRAPAATRSATRSTCPRSTSTSSTGSARSRASGRAERARWRSPGSSPGPA
jgi:aryl-alcohol dehydrogenase-like predicted oxidoreductase